MIRLIHQLEALSHRGARLISLFGLISLMSLAFATVLDVMLRWLFNSPITGVRDAASLFVAIVIASALPICLAERKNITIRFLGRMLGRRWDKIMDIFGNMFTLIIFALIAWQVWLYAENLGAQQEVTMVLNWPLSPWWRSVSIIFALCVPVQAIVLLVLLVEPSSRQG